MKDFAPSPYIEGAKLLRDWVGIPGLIGIPTAVLFAPKWWGEPLGFMEAREKYRLYFGMALALGVTMLGIRAFKWMGSLVVRWIHDMQKAIREVRFRQLWDGLDHIQQRILKAMHPESGEDLTTAHNYIDDEDYRAAIFELRSFGLIEGYSMYSLTAMAREGLDGIISDFQRENAERVRARRPTHGKNHL